MSSHHVVREKQEPALLVVGLERFSDEMLGQLLEWSPTVIVTDQTAEHLHAFGIKIDYIVTDAIETHDAQSDVNIIPRGGDSHIEAALKFLVTKNYPAVNIVTDEPDLKDYLFFTDKINLVILCGNRKIYAITSGFTKWKPAGEVIEVISHPHELHVDGLIADGHNRLKTTHDGFFSITFPHPFIFIAEEI